MIEHQNNCALILNFMQKNTSPITCVIMLFRIFRFVRSQRAFTVLSNTAAHAQYTHSHILQKAFIFLFPPLPNCPL